MGHTTTLMFTYMLCEFSFLFESQGKEIGLIVTLVYDLSSPNQVFLVPLFQNYFL